jgi:hypothetical protein
MLMLNILVDLGQIWQAGCGKQANLSDQTRNAACGECASREAKDENLIARSPVGR